MGVVNILNIVYLNISKRILINMCHSEAIIRTTRCRKSCCC